MKAVVILLATVGLFGGFLPAGHAIAQEKPSMSQAPDTCPTCGEPVKPEEKGNAICAHCGLPFEDKSSGKGKAVVQQEGSGQTPPPNSHSTTFYTCPICGEKLPPQDWNQQTCTHCGLAQGETAHTDAAAKTLDDAIKNFNCGNEASMKALKDALAAYQAALEAEVASSSDVKSKSSEREALNAAWHRMISTDAPQAEQQAVYNAFDKADQALTKARQDATDKIHERLKLLGLKIAGAQEACSSQTLPPPPPGPGEDESKGPKPVPGPTPAPGPNSPSDHTHSMLWMGGHLGTASTDSWPGSPWGTIFSAGGPSFSGTMPRTSSSIDPKMMDALTGGSVTYHSPGTSNIAPLSTGATSGKGIGPSSTDISSSVNNATEASAHDRTKGITTLGSTYPTQTRSSLTMTNSQWSKRSKF